MTSLTEGEFLKPPSRSKQSRSKKLSMKEVFRLRGKANETEAYRRRSVRDRTKRLIVLLCGAFFCFALLKSPTLAKKDQQPQESSFPMSVGKHVSFEAPGESLKTSPQTNQATPNTGLAVAPHPDAGLVINPTFDTSITNNANAAAIEAMVNNAIAVFQAQFSDPITVSILFRYSTTAPNGSPLSSGTLAQSGYVVYAIPWNTYTGALTADAKTTNDVTANGSLPGSALSTNIRVSSANGRALGMNTPGALNSVGGFSGTFDGIVTLNSADSFQFTRPPGSNFDAQRSTEHEMDEVLGLGSLIGGASDLQPQDLFSWSAPGTRNLTSTGSRYFSINGGTSNIVDFNQNPGGDFGDWLSASCPQPNPYVQNAFGCAGQASDVAASSPEGINLDVIGYDLVTASSTIQFSVPNYPVIEGDQRVNLTVTRSGDTTSGASVSFATFDGAGLQPCSTKNGIASPRCDYINTLGTMTFAAGETSKSFSIAIIDDSYAEGNETFTVSLNSPSGATLGAQSTATVTIIDNDNTDGPNNPIDNTNFFVRQQYIDFLGREPDSSGAAWESTINNCATDHPGHPEECDRVHVSQSFFQSDEFQTRGYFVYRFYDVAFGRKPDYGEFVPDLAGVSGFLTQAQLDAAKTQFSVDFTARPAFANTYNPLTNQQYVDMLLNTAGVTLLPSPATRQALINGLNNSTMTRAVVLRTIVESPEVATKYNHQAYAVMEYFGYLRRQPDAFYLVWIQVLDQSNDPRGMVTGFVTSTEYRNRFGP